MKRKFSLFWVVYSVVIFYPIGLIYTLFTAFVTLLMVGVRLPFNITNAFVVFWARFICNLAFCPVEVRGRDKIDDSKSYIFLSNHQGTMEIFAIYGYIGKRFSWIMKQELRKFPLVGDACVAVGHIFIDRSNSIKSHKSIMQAEKVLSENNSSIVMFPEGTRTRTGEMGRFKRGAFAMARDLNLPIVPITINGSYEAKPKGSFWVKGTKIELVFHEPIETTDLNDENMGDMMNKVKEIIASDLKL